jgi:hypothetical protein
MRTRSPTHLDAGRLGGYAADVFAMEDWLLPDRPPAIPDRLLRHPRTLFTPHLGSAADDVRRRMSLQAARQVRQVLEGQRPDHAVNQPLPVSPGRPDDVGRAGDVVGVAAHYELQVSQPVEVGARVRADVFVTAQRGV